MKITSFVQLVLALIVLSFSTTYGDPLEQWFWRHPMFRDKDFNGVAYGNGTFVLIGGANSGTIASSAILSSPDGKTWTLKKSGIPAYLSGVSYGNGQFVVVGWGVIFTSPDGEEWTEVPFPPFSLCLQGIAYGGGKFIAVGVTRGMSTIITSSDGKRWQSSQSFSSTAFPCSVVYGNGSFLAVGREVMSSPDGTTWTVKTRMPANNPFCGVTYGNGLYVAVESAGAILTSSDGETWVPRTSGQYYFRGVTFGNGIFIAVDTYNDIFRSFGGETWTKTEFHAPHGISGVGHGSDLFIAFGNRGAILISPDGLEWSSTPYAVRDLLNGVSYLNNLFLAVGENGALVTSPDGVTWEPATSGSSRSLYGVAYGNSTYVIVGENGTVLTSPDGQTWAGRSFNTSCTLTEIAFGNDRFVVGGVNCNEVFVSPDGETWEGPISSPPLSGITFGKGIFVAVGEKGILTSLDGETWTVRYLVSLKGVTFCNGRFASVGTGVVLSSDDGMTWTVGAGYYDFREVACTAGNFIVMTPSDLVYVSREGKTWDYFYLGMDVSPEGFCYGNHTFVAVGTTGTIIQSGVLSEFDVHPPSLEFGDILLGESPEKSITIRNKGITSITFNTIPKPVLPLSKIADDCSDRALEPEETCNIRYRFQPDSENVSYSKISAITLKGSEKHPFRLSLKGKGVLPKIYVDRTEIDFGKVDVGQTLDETVTIRNDGIGLLKIGEIIPPAGSVFELTDLCSGQAVGPRESCTITVHFQPISATHYASEFSIPSNDAEANRLTIQLSGRGIYFSLSPEHGTTGTKLRMTGSGFGTQRGEVYLGDTTLKILMWKDDAIVCSLERVLPVGTYDLLVKPLNSPSMLQEQTFTICPPKLTTDGKEGHRGSEVTVRGWYFGTKKGKVFLRDDRTSTPCEVLEWTMNRKTGRSTIRFVVPDLYSNWYDLLVKTKMGETVKSFAVIPIFSFRYQIGGAGDIELVEATGNSSEIYLYGWTFVSSKHGELCYDQDTGVEVTWRNETTHKSGHAKQQVDCYWYEWMQEWWATIPINGKENTVTVTARDNYGNWGKVIVKVIP